MNNPPRKLFASLFSFALVTVLLLAACGGGDDDDDGGAPGQLTDPENVPTATPWQQPPEVVIIDPNNIQPLPPDGGGAGSEETPTPEAGEPGVCGQTYTVIAGDTTFGIAEKCGVDSQAIIDANPDIDPRNLTIGQVLIIPEAPAETTAEEPTDSEE